MAGCKAVRVHARKGLALARASHSSEIALRRCLSSQKQVVSAPPVASTRHMRHPLLSLLAVCDVVFLRFSLVLDMLAERRFGDTFDANTDRALEQLHNIFCTYLHS